MIQVHTLNLKKGRLQRTVIQYVSYSKQTLNLGQIPTSRRNPISIKTDSTPYI